MSSVQDKLAPYTIQDLPNLSQNTLLELAAEIMQIKKHERDDKMNEVIVLAMQEVQFFKKMIAEQGEDLFKQCLDRIKPQKMQKDDIVCRIGEIGNTFYVLIKGQVGIYIRNPKPEDQKLGKATEKSKNPFPGLLEVNVLKGGSHFGELALLNDAPRTATIVCKEKCDFAVLFRKDFKDVLSKQAIWQVKQDALFISMLPLFAETSMLAISTLIYNFKLQKLPRNCVLYREGEEPTHLYIIKNGEVKLSKKLSIKPPENPYDVENKSQSIKPITKTLELAILGQKEVFGEDELYLGKKREVTAVVQSREAEIFAVDINDFKKQLFTNEEFVNYFNSYCKDKRDQRDLRLQSAIETLTQNLESVELVDRKKISSSGKKRPMSSNPIMRSANQESRVSSKHRREEVNTSFTKTRAKVDLNTIDYNQPAGITHKLPVQQAFNKLFPQKESSDDQGTFVTNFQLIKNSTDLIGETSPLLSAQLKVRPVSMAHCRPVSNDNSRKTVINEKILFERNIFENNKSNSLPRKKPDTPNRIFRKKSNEFSSKLQANVLGCEYFSIKEPKNIREEDFAKTLISVKQKVLDLKLSERPMPEQQHISMDFLEPSSTQQRRVRSPETSKHSLATRIKNLSVFRTIQVKKLFEAGKAKNIQRQSSKMQELVKDVFNSKVKILRNTGTERTQLHNSSLELSLNNINQSSQAILLNEQAFKNPGTVTHRVPNSARSDAITRSMRNSLRESDMGIQLIRASRYCSRDNSVIDSTTSRGMMIRSLIGKSANDSL